MENKMREVAKRHNIPTELLAEAIALEREKVVLLKRRLVPVLINLIEKCSDEQTSPPIDGAPHDGH